MYLQIQPKKLKKEILNTTPSLSLSPKIKYICCLVEFAKLTPLFLFSSSSSSSFLQSLFLPYSVRVSASLQISALHVMHSSLLGLLFLICCAFVHGSTFCVFGSSLLQVFFFKIESCLLLSIIILVPFSLLFPFLFLHIFFVVALIQF